MDIDNKDTQQGQQQQEQQQQSNYNTIKDTETKISSLLFANEPNNPNSNRKDYIVSIPCTKIEKGILNDTEVKVQLRNPQMVKKNMFDTSYMVYELVTAQFNWIVKRRYSDFVWLRDCIRMLYPAALIPLLPKKKIGPKRFEEAFVIKRMKSLERFLNTILQNENFKSSTPVIVFLQTNDRELFEEQMSSMIPAPFPLIEDLMTIEGRLDVLDFENDNYEFKPGYYKNINNYFNIQNETITALNSNLKKYYQNIQAACVNLNDVKDNFHTLYLINSQAAISTNLTRANEEYETFMKNFMRIQINQAGVFNDTIRNFFKDIYRATVPFCEVLDQQASLQSEYEATKQSLLSKKETLWTSNRDITKWGITKDFDTIDKYILSNDKTYAFSKMLTEETKNLNNMNKKLGYYYKCNTDQFNRLISEFNDKFKDNLKEFSEKIAPTFTDCISVYTNLASNADL